MGTDVVVVDVFYAMIVLGLTAMALTGVELVWPAPFADAGHYVGTGLLLRTATESAVASIRRYRAPVAAACLAARNNAGAKGSIARDHHDRKKK
jgi:hypothetical protein